MKKITVEDIIFLAGKYIYHAKGQTYDGYASNDKEGDYGDWDDWYKLLIEFGKELTSISPKKYPCDSNISTF